MSDPDATLASKLAPKLKALHEANGGDWIATSRDALALIREGDRSEPPAGSGTRDSAAETADTPREDD